MFQLFHVHVLMCVCVCLQFLKACEYSQKLTLLMSMGGAEAIRFFSTCQRLRDKARTPFWTLFELLLSANQKNNSDPTTHLTCHQFETLPRLTWLPMATVFGLPSAASKGTKIDLNLFHCQSCIAGVSYVLIPCACVCSLKACEHSQKLTFVMSMGCAEAIRFFSTCQTLRDKVRTPI